MQVMREERMRIRILYTVTEILFESVMGYGHPHARGV
jgi:hypothetical protein